MRNNLRSYVYAVLALGLVVLLSFVTSAVIDPYYMGIIMLVGIHMILAASLNLINGFTGQFSLGHAGFMAIGAYAAAATTTLIFDPAEGVAQEGLFALALVAGGVAASVAGLLIGIPSLRLKGDYLAIVTLGFGEIIRVILQSTSNDPDAFLPLGGSLGIGGIPLYTTFIWTFGILVVLVFLTHNLMTSTYGRGFLATRDDEIAAESIGVNTTRYKVIAFVLGAFFAGVAGGLYAHHLTLISPLDFNFLKSVEIVVMVILGGMGSTAGVLIAAALLTSLPELLRDAEIFGIQFRDFRMPLYALTLVLLMIFRPQGLLGDFDAGKLLRRLRTKRSEPAAETKG